MKLLMTAKMLMTFIQRLKVLQLVSSKLRKTDRKTTVPETEALVFSFGVFRNFD